MRSIAIALFAALLALTPGVARADDTHADHAAPAARAETCEHGVKKSLCTRCNPKLEAVFKAKGDWCAEHSVAESQCVKCNPELAKKGVK